MLSSRFSPCQAVAVFVACGLLLWAARARAFCREVSLSPPANYDPATMGCFQTDPEGGVLAPLYWRNQCVSYSFQRQGSTQVSVADATRIAAQSFSTWSNAACPGGGTPIIFADQYPDVECDTAGSAGHNNIIIFRENGWPYPDTSNAIGYTTLTFKKSTNEILGADIEINATTFKIVVDAPASDAGARSTGDAMTYDLASILTHEAGHFLGLAHSADKNAVMYAHYHPGSTTLTADDIAGICAIYSPEGTRNTAEGPLASTACNPSPPLGFSSACGSIDAGTVGSGALLEGGADGVEAPCPPAPTCALGPASGLGGPACRQSLVACGLFGLVVLARRASRGTRRARAALASLAVVFALAGSGLLAGRDADASVSTQAFFEELVEEATGAAVVTPVEQRSLWEDGRVVTYTRMRVDRLVAGQVASDPWVRTLGGSVGDIGQLVEGEPTFAAGQPSLVFLDVYADPVTHASGGSLVVVERAQGQFPLGGASGPRLTLAGDMGVVWAPPPDHASRVAKKLGIVSARYARDVLEGRSLEDAIREITRVWKLSRGHHENSSP